MITSNIKLIIRDAREDWTDTESIAEFLRWQWLKLRDGVTVNIWPWSN